jgi:hypothetical protein
VPCVALLCLLIDDAAANKVDAKPREADLLREGAGAVVVSSTVSNAVDRPEHLVDGKLDTAWSSKTGDLRPWIAFTVDEKARVTELRLTVGYTKREKFAQNHRITKVRVTRAGKLVVEQTLDPEKPTLQAIPASGAGGEWRLEVVETVAGSKPKWKEVCITELQVIGHPDVKVQTPVTRAPQVHVGARPKKPLPTRLVDARPGDELDDVQQFCDAFEKKHSNECTPNSDDPEDMSCVDASEPGNCDATGIASLDDAKAPWVDATIFESTGDPTYGSTSCNLAVGVGKKQHIWAEIDECSGAPGASGRDSRAVSDVSITQENVAKGKAPELVVRWTIEERDEGKSDGLIVCGVGPSKQATCTNSLLIKTGAKLRFTGDGYIEVAGDERLSISFP